MPIITVQVIKGAVLTSDAQKRELLKKMTDTFINVVGEVARPFTYCIIDETPMYEWALAGVPLPDYAYLSGPEYEKLHVQANEIMRAYMAQLAAQQQSKGAQSGANVNTDDRAARADAQWGGGSSLEENRT